MENKLQWQMDFTFKSDNNTTVEKKAAYNLLPTKQARYVLAWADLHQEELLENWNNLLQGNGINKINPLM